MRVVEPVTVSEARAGLSAAVVKFRRDGAAATPLIFGSRRKAEAVVLPYETYEAMRAVIEEVAVREIVMQRRVNDSGQRFGLADVAEEFGIDLASL